MSSASTSDITVEIVSLPVFDDDDTSTTDCVDEIETAFHRACRQEDWPTALRLIDSRVDGDGKNGLFYIAAAKNYDTTTGLVEKLLDLGIDVNAQDTTKRTALCYCITYKMVQLLIDKGADYKNYTPIELIVRRQIEFTMREWIKTLEIFVTPETVKRPVEKGDSLLHHVSSSLHMYVFAGKDDFKRRIMLINRLLDNGADIISDKYKSSIVCDIVETVFSANIYKEHLELINRVMLPETIDNNVATCIAVHIKYPETYRMIKRLIMVCKFDLNKQYSNGNTLLMVACRAEKPIIYDQLLARIKLLITSENINMQNNEGQTPLIIAAIDKSPRMIQMLLEKGADKSIKDKSGNSAYHYMRTGKRFRRCCSKLKYMVNGGCVCKLLLTKDDDNNEAKPRRGY